MRFEEFKFEDLPNIMAENNRLLSEVKVLLQAATMPQKTSEDLLNIQQAGELLNLSIPTIYSKVSKKELPYSKRGKKLYFSREELTDFIKKGRVLTNSEIGNAAIHKAGIAMKGGNL